MHLFHSIYELHNIWHIHLYLYISKSWSVAFIVVMFQLSHISIHVIIILLFNFPIIFFLTFTHFLKNIYTFFNIFISLTFSSPHYPFISPLPFTLLFYLPTTLYLNITLRLSLHLPFFFCPFLFTTFYYKFITLFHFLHTFPSQKKKGSLSLSLSQFWGGFFFNFLSSLL